jgi:amino acid transporter
MAQLDTRGLLQTERPHTPNEFYPNQKFGDFSDDYDTELSTYPWNTLGNCCTCGRLQVFVFFSISLLKSRQKKRNVWDPTRSAFLIRTHFAVSACLLWRALPIAPPRTTRELARTLNTGSVFLRPRKRRLIPHKKKENQFFTGPFAFCKFF